jgi:hypothetical protein
VIGVRDSPVFPINMRNEFGLQEFNEVFRTAGIGIRVGLKGGLKRSRRIIPAKAGRRTGITTVTGLDLRNGY